MSWDDADFTQRSAAFFSKNKPSNGKGLKAPKADHAAIGILKSFFADHMPSLELVSFEWLFYLQPHKDQTVAAAMKEYGDLSAPTKRERRAELDLTLTPQEHHLNECNIVVKPADRSVKGDFHRERAKLIRSLKRPTTTEVTWRAASSEASPFAAHYRQMAIGKVAKKDNDELKVRNTHL